MKMFFMTSMILSLTFMKGSHPVSLMVIILAQTMTLCLIIWTLSKMSWFSYILFLIFVGGLMVLFIYIASLASNEMFYFNLKSTILTFMPLAAVFIVLVYNWGTQMKTQEFQTMEKSFSMMYSTTMFLPSITTMIYLLLTLVVVVKMTSKYEGPMRNMIFSN